MLHALLIAILWGIGLPVGVCIFGLLCLTPTMTVRAAVWLADWVDWRWRVFATKRGWR